MDNKKKKLNGKGDCKSLFTKLQDTTTLEAAKQYAQWTVASLFPDSTNTNIATDTRRNVCRDYQSHGALLLNNLAAKITQLLFPPEIPFFTLSDTDNNNKLASQLDQASDEDAMKDFFNDLAARASNRVFINGGYNQLLQAVKLSGATGDALLFRDPITHRFQVFSMQNYAVKRDGSGIPILIIVKEKIAYCNLPEELKTVIKRERPWDDVELYTKIKRKTLSFKRALVDDTGKEITVDTTRVIYEITQEAENWVINEEPITYPEMLCPYILIPWTLLSNENYGRGIVEEHSSGFARLSELSEATLNYEVEIMRLIHLVGPEGTNNIEDIMNAENGEAIAAPADSVRAHEGGDAQKLAQVLGDINIVKSELATAFMYTGNVRDAERVTAEEIRTLTREADYTLGGVYSSLTELLHLRLAYILLVEEDPRIKDVLVDGSFSIDINVGLASLNKQTKINQIQRIANTVQLVVPALAQATKRINVDKLINLIADSEGFPISSITYSEEELKQLEELEAQNMVENANLAQPDPNLVEINAEQQGL